MRCGSFAGPTSASSFDYQNQKSLKRQDKTTSCWIGRLHSDGLKVRFNRPLTPERGVRFPLGLFSNVVVKTLFHCSLLKFSSFILFENGRFDRCLNVAHLSKETKIISGSSHLLRTPVFCWGHPYESHQPPVHIPNKYPKTDLAILEVIRLLI